MSEGGHDLNDPPPRICARASLDLSIWKKVQKGIAVAIDDVTVFGLTWLPT